MFKEILLKWMPRNDQNASEKKLTRVMKHLKIEDYNFNWDRTSCVIEFRFQGNSYRLEHTLEKAKKKGILLKNGLDCLTELTDSLEDLCRINNRGTNQFETWISGMRQSTPGQEIPEFEEEFQIRYKSTGKKNYSEYNEEEYSPRRDMDQRYQNRVNQRSSRQFDPLI